MSFIGGLTRSFINPMSLAQLAMGPAGWASLAARAVVAQVGSQVIQQIGQQIGLPPALVATAQLAFNQSQAFSGLPGLSGAGFNPNAMLSFLQGQGMSPREAATFVRDIQRQSREAMTQELKSSVQDFVDNLNRQANNSNMSRKIDAVMNGKGSFLMKLATALGMLADKKMNDMADLTKKMGQFGEITGKNQAKYGEMTGQLQALGQEMSMISQAMANVIKTTGEAASTLARKN